MTVFTLARHLYFLSHVNASHTFLSYFFFRSAFSSICAYNTFTGEQFRLQSPTVSLVHEE